MKIHKLSSVGYTVGSLLLVSSIVRYYWLWYDPSTLLEFILISGLIFVLSYNYNWMRNSDEFKERIQRQLDALGAEVFNQTDEARKELALGYEE